MMTNDRRASQVNDSPPPETEEALNKIPTIHGSRPTIIMSADLRASDPVTGPVMAKYTDEQAKSELAIKRFTVKDGGIEIESPMGKYCIAHDVFEMRRRLVKRAKKAEERAAEAEDVRDLVKILQCATDPSAKLKRVYRKLFEARRDNEQLIEMNDKMARTIRAQGMALQAQADVEAQMLQNLHQIREQASGLEWFKAFDKLAHAVHELMTTYPHLIVQSGSQEIMCPDEASVSRDAFVALIGARDAVEAQKKQETTEEKKS